MKYYISYEYEVNTQLKNFRKSYTPEKVSKMMIFDDEIDYNNFLENLEDKHISIISSGNVDYVESFTDDLADVFYGRI